MGKPNQPGADAGSVLRYYRLTPKGKFCADLQQREGMPQLPHYQRDVLLMCSRGISLAELRQFMPPQSLQTTLHSLLELGLIECLQREQKAPRATPTTTNVWGHRFLTG